MKRFLFVVLFLFVAFFLLAIIGAGSHGHIMFRPHIMEDWLLWGCMVVSALLGIYFLVKRK